MTDLHAELTALTVEWPATPDLAGAVAERIESAAPPAAASPSGVAAGAGLRARRARWPPSRSRWRRRRTPARRCSSGSASRASRSSAASRPRRRRSPGRARLRARARHAGHRSPRRASARRSCACRRPTGSGEPDAIYLGGESVSLVYGERPGYPRAGSTGAALLVQEFPARVEPFIEKTLGERGAAGAPARRRRARVLHRRRARVRVRERRRRAASRISGWRGTRCSWSGRTGCCCGWRATCRGSRRSRSRRRCGRAPANVNGLHRGRARSGVALPRKRPLRERFAR